MTLKFYEYSNSVVFSRDELEQEPVLWEEGISVGDSALYHDSKNGTRPLGHVVSISPDREYLLVRLASFELFIILRRVHKNEYLVIKSDIRKTMETTGKMYYEGTAQLQNVFWETDPEKGKHIVFLWFLNGEHRMQADIVNFNPDMGESELVDYISGRYELSE